MRLNHIINSNILLFIILTTLFFTIKPYQKVSTSIEDILPNSPQKELIKQFNSFNSSKKLFIAVKGFDDKALAKIKSLKKRLLEIKELEMEDYFNNQALRDYFTKYQFFIKEFTPNQNIDEKLQNLHNQMLTSAFFIINKDDPLNLFKAKYLNIKSKNFHLILGDYGYLSIFNIDSSNSIDEYKKVYNQIEKIKVDNDTKIFSPIFYFVENSNYIKNDINKIVSFSMVVLFFLYLFLLKNFKLFFNTTLTLISSVFFAFIVISFFYQKISIFVIAFSVALSTIAIDYMFHHYLHNFYSKKEFNKDVFFGFMTTFLAFFIFSFINFPLISQISLFSLLSLTFSYLIFAFLYPQIGFIYKNSIAFIFNFNLSFKKIFFISLVIFTVSLFFVKVDSDIKNLDYQNKKLQTIEQFFKNNLATKELVPIIIKAKSINQLITNSKKIDAKTPITILLSKSEYNQKIKEFKEFDFEKFKFKLNQKAKEIGFREGFFNSSYSNSLLYPPFKNSFRNLKEMGFDIIYQNQEYFTLASIQKEKIKEISKYDFVEVIELKKIFMDEFSKIFDEIMIYGLIVIFIISLTLIIVAKKRVIAFCFLIAPLAMIFLSFSFVPLNLMSFFIIFILLAMSIDYAIYISNNHNLETKKAIFYSLISTFGGFGVLIFSQIKAINSLGLTALVGIITVWFLISIKDISANS